MQFANVWYLETLNKFNHLGKKWYLLANDAFGKHTTDPSQLLDANMSDRRKNLAFFMQNVPNQSLLYSAYKFKIL